MSLRAIPPEKIEKRLKLMMFGPAGVGKTWACCQMPRPYLVDAEHGMDYYAELINRAGGRVFQTTDVIEVIQEVKSLLTEPHDFRSLVIDPITPLYQDLLDKSEAKVGTEWGRHYGEANKAMKRLANLLMALDMNVIVVCHAKAEYGPKMERIGNTFDGWKRLDYLFDLVVELEGSGNGKDAGRVARVEKSRIAAFPSGSRFPWSYQDLAARYGKDVLDRQALVTQLAGEQQLKRLGELLEVVKTEEGWTEKVLEKAAVDRWEDMPSDKIQATIDFLEKRLTPAAQGKKAKK